MFLNSTRPNLTATSNSENPKFPGLIGYIHNTAQLLFLGESSTNDQMDAKVLFAENCWEMPSNHFRQCGESSALDDRKQCSNSVMHRHASCEESVDR